MQSILALVCGNETLKLSTIFVGDMKCLRKLNHQIGEVVSMYEDTWNTVRKLKLFFFLGLLTSKHKVGLNLVHDNSSTYV
jgi:hypothetical protein